MFKHEWRIATEDLTTFSEHRAVIDFTELLLMAFILVFKAHRDFFFFK